MSERTSPEPDEATPALSIGSIEGGTSPSMSRWRHALTQVTLALDASSEDARSPLHVNVIYQVPGNLIKPDFEGVRTGYYSKKRASLIVQVASPRVRRRTPKLT